MNYIQNNKEAWEEAFEKHQEGWKNQPIEITLEKDWAFFNQEMVAEFREVGIYDKDISQFCCNNGRELLSIVKTGAKSGIGFDIAENFVEEGNRLAQVKGLNCQFISSDILEIGEEFRETFDIVFTTIGAYCWFSDLDLFFQKVSLVLKSGGVLLLQDGHPCLNMFAMEGEKEYDEKHAEKIIHSYFRNDPWIENKGIDYVGGTQYESKTLTSYSHTLSDIINAIIKNNISIDKVYESNQSLHNFEKINNGKIPLTIMIRGKKR